MKTTILSFLMAVSAFAVSAPAMAADQGTADEAVAMVEKTIKHFDENGKEATYKLINDPKDTEFHDRDLYVFIISLDGKGTFVSHGAKPTLIGKHLIGLKDVKGSPLVKNFVEMVQKNGSGWVDYYWPHPQTKKTTAKSSFVKKYDEDVLIGVGIYK